MVKQKVTITNPISQLRFCSPEQTDMRRMNMRRNFEERTTRDFGKPVRNTGKNMFCPISGLPGRNRGIRNDGIDLYCGR